MIAKVAVLYLFSYLCGAVPFGVLIAKSKGIDLMSVGSGNTGATNVSRALGTRLGLLVFFLDVAKGAVPGLVARLVVTGPLHGIPAQGFWVLAGLIAVFGHCASPFLGFKGGKGVSTALGMVVGGAPLVALASFSLFLVLLLTTQYMSLASLIAVAFSGVFGWFLPGQAKELLPLYIVLFGFVAYRHRKNIGRLANGTEPKFTFKKPKPENDQQNEPPDESIESESASGPNGSA